MAEATNPIPTASNPRVGPAPCVPDCSAADHLDYLSEVIVQCVKNDGVRADALGAIEAVRAKAASAPTPPDRVGSVEKLAAAIDAADHGYSIKLKSLTEAGSVYTLDLCDGSDLIEFSDREDAREYAERHRSIARAKAALAFLFTKSAEAR